jgi:hypothetical protein
MYTDIFNSMYSYTAMIQAAHVGVGIRGEEGLQAMIKIHIDIYIHM